MEGEAEFRTSGIDVIISAVVFFLGGGESREAENRRERASVEAEEFLDCCGDGGGVIAVDGAERAVGC